LSLTVTQFVTYHPEPRFTSIFSLFLSGMNLVVYLEESCLAVRNLKPRHDSLRS
jgi:hypothetical protein